MSNLANTLIELDSMTNALSDFMPIKRAGTVRRVSGLLVESDGPNGSVGDMVWIITRSGEKMLAEVVGLHSGNLQLIPFEHTNGISIGNKVEIAQTPSFIGAGQELLGRIIDGFGNPIDNKGPFITRQKLNLNARPPRPLHGPRIEKPFQTGIRSIDGLVTCGEGQRMGIFAGSGVGKSVLLGMIAKQSSADINVIALIGERGREVREFVERNLGAEGLKRSVVVVVTSEQAPVLRIRGANIATRIAEHFRDSGNNVLLMMDSLTRVAMAQREIGLAVGEPPTTKGYTPSVYALLPKLLERAGTSINGSITG
jgi:flagellum-specific ATP synthase